MNKKIGLVITAYDRIGYLQQCLESLAASDITNDVIVVIIDDHSKIPVSELVTDDRYTIIRNDSNQGVCYSLNVGFSLLSELACDLLINLDSDAIVRNDFFSVIKKLHDQFPDSLVTGFNSENKNRDGSSRHPILELGDGYCKKKSVGGINFAMSANTYNNVVRYVLEDCYKMGGNWDHEASKAIKKRNGDIICAVPSVVQHIGIESSMGHDDPDISSDFKNLHLPDVTIIGVDCIHPEALLYAINQSCSNIQFGAVKLLSSKDINSKFLVKIPGIKSIEEYSRFMIKELYRYVDTKYALIVQHDGYVKNWKAWENDFLNYDYIGATWWYKDGMNVGNGGFSLRSKKLLNTLANSAWITKTHPEDHHICRTYRKILEQKHAIKYAPESVAKRFSIEGYRSNENEYSNQFGFHGKIVKFHNNPEQKTFIMNQPRGLGDIIFCMKIAQDLVDEGHKVIWPVVPEYVGIGKHFPEITFIDWRLLNINYENKKQHDHFGSIVIPMRFADSICKVPYKDCMKSKYMLVDKDWRIWDQLSFKRDPEAEISLEEIILKKNGIKKGDKYNLVNVNFRTDMTGIVNPEINNHLPCIYMTPEPGFTMIDWSTIIERAEIIHTVGTSINYLLELLTLQAQEVHLYVRRPDEVDFSNYDYILTEKVNYIFHK